MHVLGYSVKTPFTLWIDLSDIIFSFYFPKYIEKIKNQNKTGIQATEADVDLQSSFLVCYYSFVIMTEIKISSIKQVVFIARASLRKSISLLLERFFDINGFID